MKAVPVVEAAGALVWRVRQGRLQVVLVHRPRYKDWSWPKGKLEPGEHVVTAAVREVEEEAGLDVVLGRPLPGLEYPLADGRFKRVHYWSAQVAGRPDRPAV
ncbi:NUDIX domain-containing protein, partial [Cellulomonas hominis]|nr:NUDIX domain-containing protein [Cellulomonas hominis]